MEFVVQNAADVDGQYDKIIKWSDVTSVIDEGINTFQEVYIGGITDMLNEEMSNGGLNPYALCIEGETPAYEKANALDGKVQTLSEDVGTLNSKIESAYNEQRANELKKLSSAIGEAITQHKTKRDDYQAKANALAIEWDKVDAEKSKCSTAGTKYIMNKNYLSNVCSAGWEQSLGEPIYKIYTPFTERNYYDDDIQKEQKEIDDLNERKTSIDSEESTTRGKVE